LKKGFVRFGFSLDPHIPAICHFFEFWPSLFINLICTFRTVHELESPMPTFINLPPPYSEQPSPMYNLCASSISSTNISCASSYCDTQQQQQHLRLTQHHNSGCCQHQQQQQFYYNSYHQQEQEEENEENEEETPLDEEEKPITTEEEEEEEEL
jgi:hypothetical protein